METFLEPDNHNGLHQYVSFSIPESDPPDAIIYKENDDEALLEITELVNQDAIHLQIKNDPAYSVACERWTDLDYFESQLNNNIQIKNKKCAKLFKNNKKVHLLLHTDELWLEASYDKHFQAGVTIQPHNFENIWLMLSYSPHTKTHKILNVCQYVSNV